MNFKEKIQTWTKADIKNQILESIINSEAFKYESNESNWFQYKSGERGPIYIDLRNILLDSSNPINEKILSAMIDLVKSKDDFSTIAYSGAGGSALGADIGSKLKLQRLFDRGKPKDHGSRETIVGSSKNPENIAIIDDVFNFGTSVGITINNLKLAGKIPTAIFVVVNRSEPRIEEFMGIPIYSLFKLEDLVEKAKK